MRYIFGPWLPDLPPHGHDGLVLAENCYPSPAGYRPVKGFAPLAPALAGFMGGAAYVSSDGTTSLIAGTATDLWLYSGAWASVLGSLAASEPWRFTQFADTIVCVAGGAPVAYDLTTQSAVELGGSPPNAGLCATVREFVVLAGDADAQQSVSWSDQGLPDEWTAGQAGSQPLYAGGEITGLAGGEYGVILQRHSVKRMSYTGDPALPFQFDEIGSNIGCIAKGSVAQHGRLIFFLSERGFAFTEGTDVTFIGNEKVDRTFFAMHPRADLDRLCAAVDPRNSLVIWAMPGNPGRLWIYNWVLDRFSTATLDIGGLFSGFTANVSIDALDGLFPDGIDSVAGSLDDAAFQGGSPLLIVVAGDGTPGVLTGANLVQSFRMPFVEPVPGRHARIWNARPIGDAIDATMLTLDARVRIGDGPAKIARTEIRRSGDLPIRADGRFVQAELVIADPACSFTQGIEFDAAAGGRR